MKKETKTPISDNKEWSDVIEINEDDTHLVGNNKEEEKIEEKTEE